MMMSQMLEYQRSLRSVSTSIQGSQDQLTVGTTPGRRHIRTSPASRGAHVQLSGFARIKTIERSLSNPKIT
jgi:hypothetical protein